MFGQRSWVFGWDLLLFGWDICYLLGLNFSWFFFVVVFVGIFISVSLVYFCIYFFANFAYLYVIYNLVHFCLFICIIKFVYIKFCVINESQIRNSEC